MKTLAQFLSILILITAPVTINFSQTDTLKSSQKGKLGLLSENDSLRLAPLDTILEKTGASSLDTSARRAAKPSPIEEPVEYQAKDSIVMTLNPQKIYLYRDAAIRYGTLDLKAYYIEVDLEKKELYARGQWDTVSATWLERPVFNDKEKSFDADELRYNFETRQGLVTRIFTKEGEGYLHGERVKYKQERYKKDTTEVVYVRRGAYTTCNAPEPHFGIKAGKIKVIPRKRIITGPAYMVVSDIPTPLAFPFGYFPNSEERTSGIIFPQYGYQAITGFFFRDGGYYYAISPKVDLKFMGSIFTNGSWAAGLFSDYKIRYKMSGSLSFNFSRRIEGNDPKIKSEFSRSNEWRFRWTHTQDPKSLPGFSFRSDVNVVTAGFNKFNQFNVNEFIQNKFTSTIALGYSVPRTPFNIQTNLRLDQNTSTRILNLNAPEIVWTTNRFFPFKSRKPKPRRWWRDLYEGLGIVHRTEFGQRITLPDSLFMRQLSNFFSGYSANGLRHSFEAATTVKLFKYISLVPTARYVEVWNFRRTTLNFDPTSGQQIRDTLRGFYAGRTFNASVNVNTNLFAFFTFHRGRVKGLRYLLQPTAGFTYAPYSSSLVSGYFGPGGALVRYDPFQGVGLFGGANQTETGAITFALNNNLELKATPRKDTGQGDLKIKLVEFLGISSAYNFFADSFQLSPINLQSRNAYLNNKIGIVFSATFDPYTVEDAGNGTFVRRPYWEVSRSGKLVRLTNLNLNVTFNLIGRSDRKVTSSSPPPGATPEEWEYVLNHPWDFIDFKIPYSLNVGYVFSYSRPLKQITISNILTVSGDLRLTPNWKIDFRSAYDFYQKKFSPSATSLGLSRDLHCWQMDFQWIPFGTLASYIFTLRAKAALLQDLKLNRRRGWVPVMN